MERRPDAGRPVTRNTIHYGNDNLVEIAEISA
jgi:hypothetical protein